MILYSVTNILQYVDHLYTDGMKIIFKWLLLKSLFSKICVRQGRHTLHTHSFIHSFIHSLYFPYIHIQVKTKDVEIVIVVVIKIRPKYSF